MHARALQRGKKYFLKHTTQHRAGRRHRDRATSLNIDTLESMPAPGELAMNDIGEIRLRAIEAAGIMTATRSNRLTGSFILIEQGTNATVAAGMLPSATRDRET